MSTPENTPVGLIVADPDKWPVELLLMCGFVAQVGDPDVEEKYVWTEQALRLADEFWRDRMASLEAALEKTDKR